MPPNYKSSFLNLADCRSGRFLLTNDADDACQNHDHADEGHHRQRFIQNQDAADDADDGDAKDGNGCLGRLNLSQENSSNMKKARDEAMIPL